jgi:two-component system OmpR family response regulator
VLIVEDEPQLAEQLAHALARGGYAVDRAATGDEGRVLGAVNSYDAVLLDLGLPNEDGLTVLRRWRDAGILAPVLILTARSSWHDKVVGIDAGADDYLAKPFQMEELLARLRALIRRSSGHGAAQLSCGAVVLDTRTGSVSLDGAPVALTAHEFRVLSYLMHHRGRLVSQAALIEHVYAEDRDRDSNTIEVFIARLRRKVGADLIRTVRGRGYVLDATS